MKKTLHYKKVTDNRYAMFNLSYKVMYSHKHFDTWYR